MEPKQYAALMGRLADLRDEVAAVRKDRRPVRQVRYLSAASLEHLQAYVMAALAEGWDLAGPLVVSQTDVIQAVVRYDEPRRAGQWVVRTLVRLACGHVLELGADLWLEDVRAGPQATLAEGNVVTCPHEQAPYPIDKIWLAAEEEV